MEIWDLYTADRQPTGKTMIRGEQTPEGLYHLGVHAWVRNSEGKYIISQRSPKKETCPLMWETVAGSVVAGENSLMGVLREVREEIGLDFAPEEAKLVYSQIGDGITSRGIVDIYLFEYDGEIDLSRATTDEVIQSKWMTCDEIAALRDSGKLVTILDYFFEGKVKG
jgi:8-oxo-dGTP pyrophosphatase MutT (NUDIX family)